jgi:hypothetical protein
MRAWRSLAAACALLCAAFPAHALPQVFLVQNSGWMEPFYVDPASQFKPLVAEVVNAVARPGDALVLAAFNQGVPGAPSPKALLSFRADASVKARSAAALAGLGVAHKPNSAALADTDLGEAVNAAIVTALAGKPGIVWLFTNNRNSPNNDQATATRNREFYTLIHQGGAITKALAFPLKMPVQGAHYRANGLMVYAFAVGSEGARELDALLAAGSVQKVITEPPARLKPIDRDTVRLLPRKVEGAPGVTFSTGPGGMLRADIDASTRAPEARIVWGLENRMYPYTISSAQLAARSHVGGEDRPITLGKSKVTDLAPGNALPLSSTMALPVKQLPGNWSLAALQSAGSAYVLPGRIDVQLTGQKLVLSEAFRTRMSALFPGDPLPEIFTPPEQIQASTAVLPLEVRVHYGMAPLLALGAAALALLGAAAVAATAYGRPRKVTVTVEDELRTMQGRPGSTQPIYDRAGQQVAQLKTTMFGHELTDLRDGAQVRISQ